MLHSQPSSLPAAMLSPSAPKPVATKVLKKVPGRACHNCKTDVSPMWRRRFCPEGAYSCNACYMYAKNHGGAMRKTGMITPPGSPSSSLSASSASVSPPMPSFASRVPMSASMAAFRKALEMKRDNGKKQTPQYQCQLRFYCKPVSKISLKFITDQKSAPIRFTSQRDGSSLLEAACQAPMALPKLRFVNPVKHDSDVAFLISELR